MKLLVKAVPILWFVVIAISCSKTSFITSPDASLGLSSDTLHFDTVFTTTGSVTQSLKILNLNGQKLRLSAVKLMGGAASVFKLNVDGTPGVSFYDVELQPNDSLYIFVSVSINPSTANLPFIVRDSILLNFNGVDRFVQLQAFGQNANFFANRHITKDSTWKNDLPFVILGGVTVDSSVTLTIEKGCRIYAHANAPFIVNGSLKVNGEASEKVVFQGDRVDPEYRDLPGGWPGVFFSASSSKNVLNYAVIKNAFQGVITASAIDARPKITLNQCIIDNIYDAGIISLASSISANNCLISNCGSNIVIAAGGNYSFNHCTVATYGNLFIDHKNPVLSVSNAYQNQVIPLSAQFTNCVFYGEGGIAENEILVEKRGTPTAGEFSVVFQNVSYKSKADISNAAFNNSIKNAPPLFDSIDAGRRYFDFHLKSTSPLKDLGLLSNTRVDLDGKLRDAKPDIGCYEY
jgi:hypothetical protein